MKINNYYYIFYKFGLHLEEENSDSAQEIYYFIKMLYYFDKLKHILF